MPERRQGGFHSIDQLLQPDDVLVRQPRFGRSIADLVAGIRELRAERKQIPLQTDQFGVDLRVGGARPCDAEMGVHFVDLTVRVDSRIVLGDARSAEERRLARISCPRVDLHGQEA